MKEMILASALVSGLVSGIVCAIVGIILGFVIYKVYSAKKLDKNKSKEEK